MPNFFKSFFSGKSETPESEKQKNDRKRFEIFKYDGLRAQRMGRPDYAVKCFTEALAIEEDFETMGYLSQLYIQTGETEKARELLEKMAIMEPHVTNTFLTLANVCFIQEDYKAMEEAASKAIAIEEGNAVAHYLLGKARKGQDDDLMTIAHLTKAIALKDDFLEARLMRACAYFYMVRLWGPVIIIEDNDKVVANPMQPLHREEDVLELVIRDLTYAVENLPEVATAKGRVNAWGAKGMLAKVYLARSGWKGGTRDNADLEKAKELAADVINNSGISLYENYEDLFKYKHNNNPESLIAMQWVPLGDWGGCNTLLADLAGNSKMTGGVNVWSSYQASIDMLQQYELGDTIRRNATFCTPGTYYSYICIADGGYTYDGATSCIKKGVPGGPDDDNDGYIQSMNSPLNTYILRLADVYLTYAEACLGNSEELAGGPGLEALNQVRDRARIPRKERVTFEDIIRERRVEFSMEYCNWYDMVSWYHWKPDYMLNYFQNQHRGYTVDLIVKDEDGYLHFGKKEGDTFLEGIENWQEPGENIEIHHGNILMPYPESDVIQNPLLNEEPVAYEFSE